MSKRGTRKHEPNRWAIVAALSVFAACYVAYRSWLVSLWYDEAATVSAANRSLSDLGRLVQNVDAVHGLYYLLMHWWVDLTGTSAFWVRLPSAIAIGVGVFGTYLLAKKLLDAKTALLAAALLLVLPRVTWAGIEARSSALTLALAVWLVLAFVLAVEKSTFARWAGFTALFVLGTWLNIFLALLAAAFAVTLWLVRADRHVWRSWLIASGVSLAASLPVVLAAKAQSAQLGGVQLPLATMVRSVAINQWFLGDTPAQGTDGGGSSSGISSADILSTPWLAAALGLTALGWFLVAVALLPERGRKEPWPPRVLAVAVPWLLVPSVIAISYSLLVSPLYHQRYFVFCAPALAILLACGLSRIPGRAVRIALTVVLIGGSLVVYASQRGETAKSGYAWSQVAELVEAQAKPGDSVYYGPRTPPEGPTAVKTARLLALAYPQAFAGLTDVTLKASPADDGSLSGVSYRLDGATEQLADASRVWVVRWADYPPAAVAAENAVLEQAGLSREASWVKGATIVSLFVRH